MMYVGKKGSVHSGEPEDDDMKIPNRYNGIAFDSDGTPRDILSGPHYDPDGEELRRAEELFRRGYVFEDQAPVQAADTAAEADTVADGPQTLNDAAHAVHTESEPEAGSGGPQRGEKSVAASSEPCAPQKNEPQSGAGGLLSGLFGRITTEELLIGGLIVLLLSSGADDELLIMLVVLLFC